MSRRNVQSCCKAWESLEIRRSPWPQITVRRHVGNNHRWCHYNGISHSQARLQTVAVAVNGINLSTPVQDGRHFADDSFKGIFMNEKFFNFDSNFTEVCSQWSN